MRNKRLVKIPTWNSAVMGLVLVSCLPGVPYFIKTTGQLLQANESTLKSNVLVNGSESIDAAQADMVRAGYQVAASATALNRNDVRFELLLSLDLLVRWQQHIRQEEGAYSSSLGRLPQVIGASRAFYQIDVQRASRDQLIVSAKGAPRGNWLPLELAQSLSQDTLSINQNYKVRANFPLPEAPRGFLRAVAQTVMSRATHELAGRSPRDEQLKQWEGVYQGHFRYERRASSTGEAVFVALAVSDAAKREVPSGELVYSESEPHVFQWASQYRNQKFADLEAKIQLQHVYLAQQTVRSITGRYTDNLEHLAALDGRIAVLKSSLSPYQLDGLELDASTGFHAEVVILGSEDQIKNLWSMNSFGQATRYNPVEEMMGRLSHASRVLEPQRKVSGDPSILGAPSILLPQSQNQ